MTKRSRTAAVVCCLWPVVAQCIGGTIRYVSTTGGNISPYDSWAKAARNPNDAVATSVAGDTVYLAPGTYTGTLTVDRGITVQGTDVGVIINGNGGKGLKVMHTSAVVGNLDITGSRASFGAGVDMDGGTIQDCRIYGNRASSSGGGVFINTGGYVRRCQIYSNTSGVTGGGVSCNSFGYVLDSRIYANVATNSGGGVHLKGWMENCDVYGNTAGEGGGIYVQTGSWVSGCRLHENTATNGAAISCRGSVDSCRIVNNSGVGCRGAGVMLYPEGIVANSLFNFNKAYNGWGGGIYFNGGGTCAYCTIANNGATGVLYGGLGGGICVATNGTIMHSIIFRNTALSGSNHFETAGSSYVNTCTLPGIGTDSIGLDPQFVSAVNHRLRRDSPCVDSSTGVGWSYDIEGLRRPMDGNFDGTLKIDVGAFERGHVPSTADYDSDGATDLAVYAPSALAWYITSRKWGVVCYGQRCGDTNAVPVRGDFDGDGRGDLVTYLDGTWLRRDVGLGVVLVQNWGFAGCIPASADYDGDGYTDFAVFYPPTGEWYIRSARTGASLAWGMKWGFSGCIPVPGDYDGDGNFDLGLYNPTTGLWYIGSLTRGVLAMGANWGFAGCTPVPGDYDGDGRSDLAVFNAAAGTWYIRTLSGTVLSMGANWGFAGCKPVSGDFDCDGKFDLAVYNQAGGAWYIRSVAGTVIAYGQPWGWAGADPVQ